MENEKMKNTLLEIINFVKDTEHYYDDEELEDDFCFSSPDDSFAWNNSVILAKAREGLGEKVKWIEKQKEFFEKKHSALVKNNVLILYGSK